MTDFEEESNGNLSDASIEFCNWSYHSMRQKCLVKIEIGKFLACSHQLCFQNMSRLLTKNNPPPLGILTNNNPPQGDNWEKYGNSTHNQSKDFTT